MEQQKEERRDRTTVRTLEFATLWDDGRVLETACKITRILDEHFSGRGIGGDGPGRILKLAELIYLAPGK